MTHRRLVYITSIGVLVALSIFLLYPRAAGLSAPSTVLAHQIHATPEVTTIRWFMRWDETRLQKIALPLIAAFEKQHPTIHVELQNISKSSEYYRTLEIALDQGEGPDVFYPSTAAAYALALKELLLPLEDWVAADNLDLAAFDPDVLALYRDAAQELHCLPLDTATLAVFYNKDLFDAAGVPYPEAPWTWDDFLAIAQQLTRDLDNDGRIEHYGVDRFDAYWPLVLWTATGHNVFDDPYAPTVFRLKDKAAITALQWLADLSLVHGVMPPVAAEGTKDETKNQEIERFLAGQAAMEITGHWRIPTYLERADLHFDFVALPAGKFTANRNDGSCFAIARNTQHQEAAWTFVKFLAGPGALGAQMLTEMQQMTPALVDLQASAAFLAPSPFPQSNKAAFLPEIDTRFSLFDPLHPIYSRWQAVTDTELSALWRGEQNAEKAVAAMAKEAAEILNNLQPANKSERAGAAIDGDSADGAAIDQAKTEGHELEGATSAFASPLALPRHYYVAPHGDDDDQGESPLTAFATLQHALNVVQAGDTIHLLPGSYFENVVSVVGGRADAPITIMGPTDAILHGVGDASAAFYLTHDYYTFVGFTMDGLHGDPSQREGYTDKLLYVQGKQVKQGVTGLRVLTMTFQNAGGECLRLRYFAQKNEIAYSTFITCGLRDFEFAEGGKNGEAIYIGTSSTQWNDGKNPTADPDESNQNWVHHNVMNTQGNECVEVKEGAAANIIEYNTCTGQLDPDSGGIGARGDGNIIRYNMVYGNVGAGVRLGGHVVDGVQYGVANEVYGNRIYSNVAGGVNIAIGPQAKICGNFLERNLGKHSLGKASKEYSPTIPCP